MGGVSIKNARILMLLMILTFLMVSLGSVSAIDIDNNETLSMAEIDTIDISQENIKINENEIVTDTPIGASLDDDILSATYIYVRDKNNPSLTEVTISVGDSINFEAMTTYKTYTYVDFGDGSKSSKIQTFANSWTDFGSHTYTSEGTYSVIAYTNYNDPSDVFTVNVGSASPFNLNIYEENHPDDSIIKYSDDSVTLSIHSVLTGDSYSASQLQSIVGSTKPIIYVDGVAKGSGNLGYDGIISTSDSITLNKGKHTIYYVLPAVGDIEELKSNELTVMVNCPDYYLKIYEVDGPEDNTTFVYDEILEFWIVNKLCNNLGLSTSEVKNSLYQQGQSYSNPVSYYVNGQKIEDKNKAYGYSPSIWVDGDSEPSSYSSYKNYITWEPSSIGVYEVYAEYSATSALGTLRSETITFYVGVEPPAGAKDITLTLTNETPINAKYGDIITITPNVSVNDDGTAVSEGDVTFSYENGTVIDTINLGQSLTLPTTLTEGTYNIKAVYNGVDGTYNPSEEVTITVVISKHDVTISSFEVTSPTYPNNAVASIVTDTPGTYVVRVNGKEYAITINEGETTGSVDVDVLSAKDYSSNVTFASTEKYNEAFKQTTFTVNKGTNNAELSIASETTLPEKVTISVNNAVAGVYTVSFNDTSIADVTITVGDSGSASEEFAVPAGSYKATLSWTNENYSDVSKNTEFKVVKAVNTVTISSDGASYPNEVMINVVADVDGDYVIVLNNTAKTEVTVTVNSGSGSESVKLAAGSYKATTLSNIDGDNYELSVSDATFTVSKGTNGAELVIDSETTLPGKVTVLTTVNGTDVVKVFRNGTQYYATFRDSEGNYLKEGNTVRFNIHGVMYDRQVAENGLARLNINLEAGDYIITAINPETGEMSSNNITVISGLIENRDITKYYRNATQYTVKVIGDDGNPVGAGENVIFNIHGVFYTRQTNESGIVKLNINLEPGDYIITAEYKECRVSNDIHVLPVLTASDLTKTYGTSDQFVATLVDGQGNPYSDQRVQFNINGVFYYRYTDSEGHAKLNINLMPGEYIITSSYNGCNIANTVKVNA